MSLISNTLPLPAAWSATRHASPALAWGGAALLALSFVSLLAGAVDERLFQGVSVWHKPWKFQISTAAYFLTIGLFLSYLPKLDAAGFARKYIVCVTFAAGLFEVGYITWQGALGLASHYNVSSTWAANMYTAMGVGAVLLTTTSGVLGWQILKNKSASFTTGLAMRHAIGWGLMTTSVLGIVTGAVLGERTRSGGHWVGGTANDALGLAVFNWSRDGGDLRVAHFFALHAMQILPLLALALFACRPQTSQTAGKRWVWGFSLVFGAFCIFTLRQALRGIPFLA
jgi:hypothetical protein